MAGSELSVMSESVSDNLTPNTIASRNTKQYVTHHTQLSQILDRVIVLLMVVILMTLSFPACLGILSQETSSAQAPHTRVHCAPASGTHSGRQLIYSA